MRLLWTPNGQNSFPLLPCAPVGKNRSGSHLSGRGAKILIHLEYIRFISILVCTYGHHTSLPTLKRSLQELLFSYQKLPINFVPAEDKVKYPTLGWVQKTNKQTGCSHQVGLLFPLCYNSLFFIVPLCSVLQSHTQCKNYGSAGRDLVPTHPYIFIAISSGPWSQSAQT